MCVATRSRNHRSWLMTTTHPAKSRIASSSARSVSTSRPFVGSSSSSTLPPERRSFARCSRFRSRPVALLHAAGVRRHDAVAGTRARRDEGLELASARLRVFGETALVCLEAGLALRLARARRRSNPLELARELSLPGRFLLLLVGEALALLLEPRAVVALVRDARALVELQIGRAHV